MVKKALVFLAEGAEGKIKKQNISSNNGRFLIEDSY
jgi:hypothetical protein